MAFSYGFVAWMTQTYWVCLLGFISLILFILITNFDKAVLFPWMKMKQPLPGSMGLPLIGETLDFIKPANSLDAHPFISSRQLRYGPVFRTSVLGYPMVGCADADLIHFIFRNEPGLFKLWFPKAVIKIFGENNTASPNDHIAMYQREMTHALTKNSNIKNNMFIDYQRHISLKISSWKVGEQLDLHDAIADTVFKFVTNKLFSNNDPSLRQKMDTLFHGIVSVPVALPGTGYHKALKARSEIMSFLDDMMNERLRNPKNQHGDFFDYLISDMQREGSSLTVAMAFELMVGLMFASFESVTITTTMAVNFISEHPPVLRELLRENRYILNQKKNHSAGLQWEDYRSMTFTNAVLNETLRLTNVSPFVFRRAMQDVEFKGWRIPKGWIVMVGLPSLHLNSKVFPDPLKFDPWRWMRNDESNDMKKYFAPFSRGVHMCMGVEMARMFMSMFLHYFITSVEWNILKGGKGIQRIPTPCFPNGLHIEITHVNKKENQPEP